MTYTVKNADGSILLTLPENEIDAKSTSITLIGRNINDYGERLNTNLVNILQNFSSNIQPRSPLVGQLWYNPIDNRLRVYSSSGVFNEIKPTQVGQRPVTGLEVGDIFIDTTSSQLYFTINGVDLVLAGPSYDKQKGKSGIITEVIQDTGGALQNVNVIYSFGKVIGVLSSGTFAVNTPYLPVVGGISLIQPGINLAQDLPNVKFYGTSTNSDLLFGVNTLTDFMINTFDAITTGSIWIKNDTRIGTDPVYNRFPGQWPVTGTEPGGLYIGSNPISPGGSPDLNIYADLVPPNRISIIKSLNQSQPLIFKQTTPGGENDLLTLIDSYIGINNINPSHTLDVNGDTNIVGNLIISGDLTVNGTQTIVNTQLLTVEDINIELANSSTLLTNLALDGGGITLKGAASNKTILYENSFTSWTLSENIRVPSDKSFIIGNTSTLFETRLGHLVTQTNVTRLGILEELTVTNIVIKENSIVSDSKSYILQGATATSVTTGSDIYLAIAGPIPKVHNNLEIVVSGVITAGYNNTYNVLQVVENNSTATLRVVSGETLASTTAVLGGSPKITINDLILDSESGNIDVSNKHIRNLSYPVENSDAATLQYVQDQMTIASIRGYVLTVDITNMLTPNTAIANILMALVPPTNTPPIDYPNDGIYDLPVGFRARVLCKTHTIFNPGPSISLAKSFGQAMQYPAGVAMNVLKDVAASSIGYTTTATVSYSVKEFRVYMTPPLQWVFYRDIAL